MPRRTARKQKKGFRRPEAPQMYRTIQTADKHPSTALVKYVYQDVWKASPSATLNLASILTIPASDLSDFTARQGSWTSNGPVVFDGLQTYLDRYYHYAVLGAKITISASSLAGQGNHQKNIMFVTETPDVQASVPSNVTVPQLQKYLKSTNSMYFNLGSTKVAYLKKGYSPRKTWSIPQKDAITSRNELKVAGSGTPNDRTFFQVCLMNPIQGDAAHEPTMLNIRVEYVVRHYEAIVTNNDSTQANME